MCSTRIANKYAVQMLFNGEKFTKQTDNLGETFVSLKPEQLHTDMFVIVKKGEAVMERHLNLIEGKMLFANPDYREIFINNLLLA